MRTLTRFVEGKLMYAFKSFLLLTTIIILSNNQVNAQLLKGKKYTIKECKEIIFPVNRNIIRNKIIIKNKTTINFDLMVNYSNNSICKKPDTITLKGKSNPPKPIPTKKIRFPQADKIESISINSICNNFVLYERLNNNSNKFSGLKYIQSDPKYTILYDVGNDRISCYKKGKYKKRINPSVNSILGITYTNFNIKEDSLVLKAEFIDRNTENEELFANIIKEGLEKPDNDKPEDEKASFARESTIKSDTANICIRLKDSISGTKNNILNKNTDTIETKLKEFIDQGIFNNNESLNNYIKECSHVLDKQADTLFLILEKLNSKKLKKYTKSLNQFNKRLQNERDALSERSFYLSNLYSNLNTSEKEIKKDILKLYKGDKENLKQEFMTAYYKLFNYSPLLHNWLQVKNYDLVKLNFEYLKNNVKQNTHELELFTSGGLKIDFSTGFVAHNLVNKNYILQNDSVFRDNNGNIYFREPGPDTATVKVQESIIKSDPLDNFSYTFGVMSHLYVRTGTRINVALTTGFTTNLESDFKFLGGLSLLLGSEKRWVISGGVIGGKRTVLSELYHVNDPYSSSDMTPPTREVMDYNWFFGISYNLGGVKLSK